MTSSGIKRASSSQEGLIFASITVAESFSNSSILLLIPVKQSENVVLAERPTIAYERRTALDQSKSRNDTLSAAASSGSGSHGHAQVGQRECAQLTRVTAEAQSRPTLPTLSAGHSPGFSAVSAPTKLNPPRSFNFLSVSVRGHPMRAGLRLLHEAATPAARTMDDHVRLIIRS